MYPTTLLLVSQVYGVMLPVEVVKYIIRLSRPVLPFKADLLTKILYICEMSPALHYRKNNSCGEEGRVESMRRAIQISILEMGIPCKPLAHGGTR